MERRAKRAVGVLTAALLAITGGTFVSSATSAAGPKTYAVSATPSAIASISSPAAITFTNTSRNDISFAAINVTVPVGVTVTSGSLTSTNGSPPSMVGNVIQMRNLTVGSRRSVTLNFSARATMQVACAPVLFTSDVRQSNDFNGVNNTFVLTGSAATFTTPCSSATVTCTADDNQTCTTGTIVSSNANSASVTLNDGDDVSAVLEAELVTGALTCPEYTATSDQLRFDITVSAGTVDGVTKSVTFEQPQAVNDARTAAEYQVCFEAPYDFPALLPSQLIDDTNNGDFSGNTTYDPATGTYRGLLLHCGLHQGVPCVENRTIAAGIVRIEVLTPALDPGMRI